VIGPAGIRDVAGEVSDAGMVVSVAPLNMVCNNTLSKSYFDELLL